MNNQWKGARVVCALLLAGALLAGCGQGDATSAASEGTQSTNTTIDMSGIASSKVKEEDLDASWDAATATAITLDGASASVSGSGASASGGVVTIAAAGTYVVSGTLEDGQIVVEAPDDALVRLVLNGASITCTTTAPIHCVTADKLLVILADGTENTLTDSDSYQFPDAETDEPSAALFSKQDLTINGTGSLVVNASYNNGIGTKDDLILVSGSITVTAANHAIRGRDSVTVLDGEFALNAGNDGLQSNNTGEDKGWIELYGGSFNITAAHDAIQAETQLAIYGGSYTLTTGGGSANAPQRQNEGFGGGRGGGGMPPDMGELPAGFEMPDMSELPGMNGFPDMGDFPGGMDDMAAMGEPPEGGGETPAGAPGAEGGAGGEAAGDVEVVEQADTESTSYKALKAGGDVTISGGSFTIDSADDAVHSNANVTISGGSFAIKTGDDGMHADETLLIEGEPDILIEESYEGLEGSTVLIRGGEIDITASDDGINAAGGTDSTGTQRDFFSAPGDYLLRIEGGTIRVVAGGDGLDSNGDLEIAGGTLEVHMSRGQAMGGDGVLDRDGDLSVTGGTILGAGGIGVVTMGSGSMTNSSTQPILEVRFTTTQSAGATVELKTADGEILATIVPQYQFQSVMFTNETLAEGQTYTLAVDGAEITQATLSGMVTTVNESGEAVSDSGMGGMGPGGVMGGDRGGPPTQW